MTPEERARRMQSLVMQRLNGQQAAIAETIGSSETTISRFKSDQLEFVCQLLSHAGLKVVPVDRKAYDPHQIEALFRITQGQFLRAESIDDVLPGGDE